MAEDREESAEGSDLYTAKGERRQFVKHSYTDYAQEDDGPLSKKDEAILQQYDENRVAGPFPLKLHIIMKILEEEGKDGEFVFGLLLVLVCSASLGSDCFLLSCSVVSCLASCYYRKQQESLSNGFSLCRILLLKPFHFIRIVWHLLTFFLLDIFSFLPHGRSFGIHKPGAFEDIIKRFFKQSQLSSFRRQLNLYGFLRLTNGRDSGSYYHELFLRGRPLLALRMTRTRIKGTKIRASSSPSDEPKLYSYPPLGPAIRPESQQPRVKKQMLNTMMIPPEVRDHFAMMQQGGAIGVMANPAMMMNNMNASMIVGTTGGATVASNNAPGVIASGGTVNFMPTLQQQPVSQIVPQNDTKPNSQDDSKKTKNDDSGLLSASQQQPNITAANQFFMSPFQPNMVPIAAMSAVPGGLNQGMFQFNNTGGNSTLQQQEMIMQQQARYVAELERTVALQNMERNELMASLAASNNSNNGKNNSNGASDQQNVGSTGVANGMMSTPAPQQFGAGRVLMPGSMNGPNMMAQFGGQMMMQGVTPMMPFQQTMMPTGTGQQEMMPMMAMNNVNTLNTQALPSTKEQEKGCSPTTEAVGGSNQERVDTQEASAAPRTSEQDHEI